MVASLLLSPLPAGAVEAEIVPFVGRDGPQADGCGGIGRIFALGPSDKARLAVLERPDEYARKKDELSARTLIWLCDVDESGDFQGIVYPSGDFQELEDCRVSTSVDTPQPYAGPCRSGWVVARNIQLVMM